MPHAGQIQLDSTQGLWSAGPRPRRLPVEEALCEDTRLAFPDLVLVLHALARSPQVHELDIPTDIPAGPQLRLHGAYEFRSLCHSSQSDILNVMNLLFL